MRFLVLIAMGLGLSTTSSGAMKCDVNGDGKITQEDITLISQAAIARAVATGPDDPRDADNNGLITSADVRICLLRVNKV